MKFSRTLFEETTIQEAGVHEVTSKGIISGIEHCCVYLIEVAWKLGSFRPDITTWTRANYIFVQPYQRKRHTKCGMILYGNRTQTVNLTGANYVYVLRERASAFFLSFLRRLTTCNFFHLINKKSFARRLWTRCVVGMNEVSWSKENQYVSTIVSNNFIFFILYSHFFPTHRTRPASLRYFPWQFETHLYSVLIDTFTEIFTWISFQKRGLWFIWKIHEIARMIFEKKR